MPADAQITGTDQIGEGDEVEVGYTGELSDDVTKVNFCRYFMTSGSRRSKRRRNG